METRIEKSPAEIAREERARLRKEQQDEANRAAAEKRAAKRPYGCDMTTGKPVPGAKLPPEVKAAAAAFAKDVTKKTPAKVAVKKLEKALAKPAKKAKAPKTPKAPKEPKERKPNKMDALAELAQRKDGVTTAELAASSGFENAGWNTIMAKLAKSRGLKLSITKREAEGSKRQLNVFHFTS